MVTSALAAVVGGLAGAAPPPSKAVPAVPIATGITDSPERYGAANFFARVHALRASFVVVDASWSTVALSQPIAPADPSDPAYDWTALDAVYSIASQYGIQIVPIVYQTPPWANGGQGPNYPPTDPLQYAAFLTAMATRYPKIRQWIIWGEPTRAPAWADQGCDGAGEYAQLLDDAYVALKHVRSSNMVIGGNNQPTGFDNAFSTTTPTWLKCMTLPNGTRPRLDMWGASTYTSRPINMALPPANRFTIDFDDLDTLVGMLDRYYPKMRLKIFISESGTPTDHANHDWLFSTTPADQAKRMRQMFAAAEKLGRVAAISNFLLDDQPGADGWTTGLETPKGVKKPAYAVFRAGPMASVPVRRR